MCWTVVRRVALSGQQPPTKLQPGTEGRGAPPRQATVTALGGVRALKLRAAKVRALLGDALPEAMEHSFRLSALSSAPPLVESGLHPV